MTNKHALPALVLVALLALVWPFLTQAASPLIVALNADMSAADRMAGEAIRHGAQTAIDEINDAGGVLGRPLALEVHDHRRNPARGEANVESLAARDEVVAVLGGMHTPVILAELETIHDHGIPYLVPWAAGTTVVENGYQPNYVFRVSARDADVGGFLVEHAQSRGFQRLGLVLEQTGWGRSNERALVEALAAHGLELARIEWFNWGERRFSASVERLLAAGADALVFVGNTPDGVNFFRAMANRPEGRDVPVISHWGITGGDFVEQMGADLERVDLSVLQTFSFLAPPFPERADAVIKRAGPTPLPAGFAHAYDLIHLLARAVELAGTPERTAVRAALEQIDFHPGLVRDYAPPFTPERHDALDSSDFSMARFVDGMLVPIEQAE